ncbi:MAG TPA: preprotein translocase subunit SecA [Candidatus Megaira endosymbiont of Nemacystus decipiens]|nr:preprotein translocase subunit SecA [Candidatus Megaera endosymbiont of Nemacystus decipiens]
MFSLLTKVFGTANDRVIKKLQKEVAIINAFEPEMESLTDEELSSKTDQFRTKLEQGASLEEIAHEAFATVREASRRVLGLRHYDVQMIGGLILHRGMINEMKTGEGKTLVSTLPAYLNAISGKGVHIVTVNEYLVTRDAYNMGKIFNFLGLSVGKVISNISDSERKDAYNCDITYATNNELGFDYLRDNMKFTLESKCQRPFNFAIIDEVDSILIDEARTPLIISGAVDSTTNLHSNINKLVLCLEKNDYEIDEKAKSVTLGEEGINKMEALLTKNKLIKENSSLYDFENLNLVHYINQALKAHNLFANNVDYLVQNKQVLIIDEFTGRVMEGRRYSDGLHQAIEAKENVPIQSENQTLASTTFQNYFRMYPKLSGMTGTAMTEAPEFKDIYGIDVVAVPTYKEIIRLDNDDVIYGTKKEKYNALIKLIKECYEKGQPVLVGTVSIEKSEEISSILKKEKIKHNVLNAKMHEKEAYIIAQAGRYKAVTIATNMAGRGTDIMLGGNLEMLIEDIDTNLTQEKRDAEIIRIKKELEIEKQKVIKAGGLYVIGTERHESRRIDNQLRGRSGRQGDPGKTQFFLSLEDDLMRIFASNRIAGVLRNLGLKDGEAIYHPMISKSLEKAQQKVEGHNYDHRKNLLKFDNVMNDQRKIIYEQRNDIISSENVDDFVNKMSLDLCSDLIHKFIPAGSMREDWMIDELHSELNRIFGLKFEKESIMQIEGSEQEIINEVHNKAMALYEAKKQEYGEKLINSAAKYILISTLDQVWKEHLHNLDHLKQGIQLRAFGQKDPLIEYKREAFGLFQHMLDYLKELYTQRICYLHIDTDHLQKKEITLKDKKMQEMHTNHSKKEFSKYNAGTSVSTQAKTKTVYVPLKERDPKNPETWGKIARNELCPCQSNKKYKHCHGVEN